MSWVIPTEAGLQIAYSSDEVVRIGAVMALMGVGIASIAALGLFYEWKAHQLDAGAKFVEPKKVKARKKRVRKRG